MRRLGAALLAVVVAAGTLAVHERTAHAAVVPTTACTIFPTNNVWNTDISGLPVNSNSAAWLNSTGANSGRLLHPDFGTPPYGIPFNVVDNSHPTTNFAFQYATESDPGPYPYGSDLQIEQGSDMHMLTVNRDTCKLYETWATNYAGASTAGSGAIFDLSSNQLRPAGWTSADAAGLPILPGLVRVDEVQAGLIAHAIRFTVAQTDKSYLWPARHQAGSASDPTLPPMGARFRLKMTYAISGFSAPTQVVLRAMQHYGLIVADNGSNWFFQGTEDPGWGSYDQMIAELKTVPANQFEAVDESSLMVDPNSALAGVPLAPTGVVATLGDVSATVTWTAPSSPGASAITSYVVTAYDGCTIQGSVTIAGTPPATNVVFTGLGNGSPYTFKVSAVNSYGAGPQSMASNVVIPAGATSPTWLSACSSRQYSLTGSDGAAWSPMDATNLSLGFTPSTGSWAIITGNVDLWTAGAGYNQDVGIEVNGALNAWKESGGFAGTFSPNAAAVQTAIQVAAGTHYTVQLVWKANRPDPGSIFAGAGPIGGAFSPTRLSVRLIASSAARVFARSSSMQYALTGNDGATWRDMDSSNLALSFSAPPGTWMAWLFGNADLWTSSPGYNQDLGIAVTGGGYPTRPGQPESWKESGGFAGTFSPNAAFVQTALGSALASGTTYTARMQWKANRPDAGTIWAGAGTVSGHYSTTTLTVLLTPVSPAFASSTSQYNLTTTDGATWQSIDASALRWSVSGPDETWTISAGADLWTSLAGYNQDIGLMVSGGAYGAGTVVAWKESGGFAGTFSPNAAFVTTNLHFQNGNTYTAWIVWKANRFASSSNAIYAGAGPILVHFSPTYLTADPLV